MESEKCPYCEKNYSKKGIGTHIWRMHGEGKDFDPNRGYKEGREIWNKGLSKESDERMRITGEKLKGKEPYIKGKEHTEKSRNKMSMSALRSFERGDHANWKSRKQRSYPELYFEEVLKELGIFDECEIEYPIKNGRYQYFLDFYFPEKSINLEIDGNQHRLKDRIISNKRRDEFLESNGIRVFRIKWTSPKDQINKDYLIKRISDFIDFYNA